MAVRKHCRSRSHVPRAILSLATACLFLAPDGAHASPLEIDDLDAAESIEIAVSAAVETGRSETTIEGPVLELAYPIAANLELAVSTGRGHLRVRGAPNRWGWLDTAIGLKGEILPVGENGGIGVTVAPSFKLPTGSHGLGGDGWEAGLPVIVALVKGPHQLRGLIGLTHRFAGNESEIAYGIAGETEVSPGFLIGAEVVGGMDGLFTSSNTLNANLGLTIALSDRLELRGRVGHSLVNDENENVFKGLTTLQMSF